MSACRQAQSLSLTGWVRNLDDGRVEIVAEGEQHLLQSLAQWAYQGPRYAEVIDVTIAEAPATGEFSGFDIHR